MRSSVRSAGQVLAGFRDLSHGVRRSEWLVVVCAMVVVAAHAARASAQGWILAEGGGGFGSGEETSPAYAWMIDKARRGSQTNEPETGPVVVLLGSPDDAIQHPDPADPVPAPSAGTEAAGEDGLARKFLAAGATRVVDLRITSANAVLESTANSIRDADIVFIRGGSQTDYVLIWQGTPVEQAIKDVFANGGVVGGTSAGCAVLGEVIYDARNASASSLDALQDAATPAITLCDNFLGLTPGVLFDTHFTERGRLARLAVMLARSKAELRREVLGIGVDSQTAVGVSPDGVAEVLGSGAVTLMRLSAESRIDLTAGRPPLITDLAVTSLLEGARFDVKTGTVLTAGRGVRPLAPEELPRPQKRELTPGARLSGGEPGDTAAGSFAREQTDEPEALWLGALRLTTGRGEVGGAVVQTQAFGERRWAEVRVGGVQWVLARQPGAFGLLLAEGCDVSAEGRGGRDGAEHGVLRVVNPRAKSGLGDWPRRPKPASLVVLESALVTAVGVGDQKSEQTAEGPRQSVELHGLTMQVLPVGWGYDARSTRPIAPSP